MAKGTRITLGGDAARLGEVRDQEIFQNSEDEEIVNSGDGHFSKQVSVWSNISRHSQPEHLMSSQVFSRQCTEIDEMASNVISESVIEEALAAVVKDCRFCVSIGDPRQKDCPLIAVSDEFQVLTGYRRDEIVGRNCRILNRNCLLEPEDFIDLRHSCLTGECFTRVITNRRKSGELFLNLIDLRGLVVAEDPRTGEELWFLVGIQADVTDIAEADRPQNHLASLHQVASKIRERISEELSTLAVSSAMLADAKATRRGDLGADTWWLSPEVGFRPTSSGIPVSGSVPSEQDEDLEIENGFGTSEPLGALDYSRQATALSEVPFADLNDGAFEAFMRQQSIAIESTRPMDMGVIHEAINEAIGDCKFVATIGDPRLDDCPLIAVSDGFEEMSGYRRDEILGMNCRFLNRNCLLPPRDIAALRECCQTGAPFTKVLLNRRKSGELFYNLLDLRGLTVARNYNTKQDLWFLVGIQADVTHLEEEDIPEDHLKQMHQVASDIRAQLAKRLSMMAVAGSVFASAKMSPQQREEDKHNLWCPVIKARWRPGQQLATPPGSGPGSSRGVSRQISRQASSVHGSRQVSAAQSGSRQVSAAQQGSRQVSAVQLGSRQVSAALAGSPSSRQVSAVQPGSRQVSAVQPGGQQVAFNAAGLALPVPVALGGAALALSPRTTVAEAARRLVAEGASEGARAESSTERLVAEAPQRSAAGGGGAKPTEAKVNLAELVLRYGVVGQQLPYLPWTLIALGAVALPAALFLVMRRGQAR